MSPRALASVAATLVSSGYVPVAVRAKRLRPRGATLYRRGDEHARIDDDGVTFWRREGVRIVEVSFATVDRLGLALGGRVGG